MSRPKSNKQPTRLTVTLDAEDYAKVCALAGQNDVSAAWIIRRAIQNYLQDGHGNAAPPIRPAFERDGGHA